MNFIRYTLAALIAVSALIAAGGATAQTYPSRPVRLVVPFPPGGVADLLARITAEQLTRRLGQQFVVENRLGAGGNIGTELVAKAAPDGYSLVMLTSGNIVINPHIYSNMGFDPFTDLAPVALVADVPPVIAIPASLPAQTLAEFIALARTRPGEFNYGSPGNATTNHLYGDAFGRVAGVQMVHVPYKGVAFAIADLATGRLQFMSVAAAPLMPYVKAGSVRILAAATEKRLSALPDIPTAAEAGLPAYTFATWFAIMAPAKTSPEVIGTLNRHVQDAVNDPEMRKRFAAQALEPLHGSPAEFAALIASDRVKWEKIVKDSGVKLQ
jgi:tripartite-type tricarboxylate transporter receptor subunit TctC